MCPSNNTLLSCNVISALFQGLTHCFVATQQPALCRPPRLLFTSRMGGERPSLRGAPSSRGGPRLGDQGQSLECCQQDPVRSSSLIMSHKSPPSARLKFLRLSQMDPAGSFPATLRPHRRGVHCLPGKAGRREAAGRCLERDVALAEDVANVPRWPFRRALILLGRRDAQNRLAEQPGCVLSK